MLLFWLLGGGKGWKKGEIKWFFYRLLISLDVTWPPSLPPNKYKRHDLKEENFTHSRRAFLSLDQPLLTHSLARIAPGSRLRVREIPSLLPPGSLGKKNKGVRDAGSFVLGRMIYSWSLWLWAMYDALVPSWSPEIITRCRATMTDEIPVNLAEFSTPEERTSETELIGRFSRKLIWFSNYSTVAKALESDLKFLKAELWFMSCQCRTYRLHFTLIHPYQSSITALET